VATTRKGGLSVCELVCDNYSPKIILIENRGQRIIFSNIRFICSLTPIFLAIDEEVTMQLLPFTPSNQYSHFRPEATFQKSLPLKTCQHFGLSLIADRLFLAISDY
jgi:hypothetical protein